MKFMHNAKITVFIKPEESAGNPGLIEEYASIMHDLAPLDFEKEKLGIHTETVDSFENRKIKILTLELSKESHTNAFLKNLKELLGEDQCKTLVSQKESRLDDELQFYIRLDKESALRDEFILTDGGDCIHIKIHLAAFPKNKQAGLKVVEKMFE